MHYNILKHLRIFYKSSHNLFLDHFPTCCVHPSTLRLADIPHRRQKKQDFATSTHGSMSKCIATNCLLMWMPPLFPPSDPPWLLVSLSPPVCLARPAKTDNTERSASSDKGCCCSCTCLKNKQSHTEFLSLIQQYYYKPVEKFILPK